MINKILKDIDNEECYYVGNNGCLYQDLSKEELLAIKQELDRLHSIIKEAREYIENDVEVYYVLDTRLNKSFDKTKKVKKDLLEILDKAGKENDIEFDVLKALNTDLDDDVEMG